jgi:hypothetical protein
VTDGTKKNWVEFVTKDNRVPLVATLVAVILAFGGMQSQTNRNSEDIRDLKQGRAEDHDAIKDLQGDIKAIGTDVRAIRAMLDRDQSDRTH